MKSVEEPISDAAIQLTQDRREALGVRWITVIADLLHTSILPKGRKDITIPKYIV